jgi:hypothetical protein
MFKRRQISMFALEKIVSGTCVGVRLLSNLTQARMAAGSVRQLEKLAVPR